MSQAHFRDCLPDLSIPRFAAAREQDAYQYVRSFKDFQQPPWLYNLTKTWESLLEEPYHGITTDGQLVNGLYQDQDEGLGIDTIVASALSLLASLSTDQTRSLCYHVNAREWRAWSNPEFLLRPLGLRLDEQTEEIREQIRQVLKRSLSPEGFEKALAAMRINGFLGELCQMQRVMNEHSYNFLLFGTPSTIEPWGWSLYGHHLCLNVFFKGRQTVISPTFTGAEPNEIDDGPYKGTAILHIEGEIGLRLMQSLSPAEQGAALTYRLMRDPGMLQSGDLAVDRWNKDDQRHLCGAFRDNRIVPYEGICVAHLTDWQQNKILAIAEEFLLYLPQQSRNLKKQQIAEHFNETYFCWIGGFESTDAFYYRVQSPVIVLEFDHHSGVCLTNEEPAKFHTHTIVRTPNAGDYGNALRKTEDQVP